MVYALDKFMFREIARKETDGSGEDELCLRQKQRDTPLLQCVTLECSLEQQRDARGGDSQKETDLKKVQSVKILRVKRRGCAPG